MRIQSCLWNGAGESELLIGIPAGPSLSLVSPSRIWRASHFKKHFMYLFLEKREGREKEKHQCERDPSISCL